MTGSLLEWGGRAAVGMATFTCVTAAPRSAVADPQASVGLTVGPAVTDLRTNAGLALHLGGRADVLLLRRRESDMAVGPYVDLATAAFDTVETGGGVEWLIPLTADVPIILSLGALARHAPGFGWGTGAESTVFLGSRSYNFDSWYSLGAGAFVQARYGVGESKQADLIVGLQIDLTLFAYPFMALYTAVTH